MSKTAGNKSGLVFLVTLPIFFLALALLSRGWKPPIGAYTGIMTDDSSYGVYLVSSFTPYESIHQIAKKHKIGLIIYQETHPWPQRSYIDTALDQLGNVVSFVTIFEENSGYYIPELNATYDYIKAKYPRVKVYQWPHTNFFDFAKLNQLKADGLIINPRWVWSAEFPGEYSGSFEPNYLFPALATGKPVINLLYLGLGSELPDSPRYIWQYAIGQYQACAKYHVPVAVYQPFSPGYEALVKERIQILKSSIKK